MELQRRGALQSSARLTVPTPDRRKARSETVAPLNAVRVLVARLSADPDVEVRGTGAELPLVSRVALEACGGALGGALGAPALHLVDRATTRRRGEGFPWDTLAINVAGSFLLDAVPALAMGEEGLTPDAAGTVDCGLRGVVGRRRAGHRSRSAPQGG